MARKNNVPRLTVETTLQLEDSCLLLDNPGEYGYKLGVIAKIDSKFILMLWDINDRKVVEKSYGESEEAEIGLISSFPPQDRSKICAPIWIYHIPSTDLQEKLKEPVSRD